MIAVSQTQPAVGVPGNKRPRLRDLRESGAIEQDADVVMFIYRDEQYNESTADNRGIAEIEVARHRRRNRPLSNSASPPSSAVSTT